MKTGTFVRSMSAALVAVMALLSASCGGTTDNTPAATAPGDNGSHDGTGQIMGTETATLVVNLYSYSYGEPPIDVAEITITNKDDQEVVQTFEKAPVEVDLGLGNYAISVTCPNHNPASKDVTLAKDGDMVRVKIDLDPLPDPFQPFNDYWVEEAEGQITPFTLTVYRNEQDKLLQLTSGVGLLPKGTCSYAKPGVFDCSRDPQHEDGWDSWFEAVGTIKDDLSTIELPVTQHYSTDGGKTWKTLGPETYYFTRQ